VLLSVIGAYAPTPWVQLGIMGFFALAVLILRHQVRSLKPFAWSLVAAAVFIVVRVVYRIVFGAAQFAPVGETVLFALPQVTLEGVFSGIRLFGMVTADALLAAASNALTFAVVFVAFGAANTLGDPRDLLTRAPKHLSAVASSLAIALSVFPSLIRSARLIRTARMLRGERGIRSLIVPLFEHTVERSERLGLSLAARGFGVGSSKADPGNAPEPLAARCSSVSINTQTVLRDISVTFAPGSVTVITGETGSGKTSFLTLLRGMFGYATGGVFTGEVLLGDKPVSLSDNIGLTSQRPEESFVAATVRQELMFGPGQRGLDAHTAAQRTAELFSLTHLLDRDIDSLSAGEAALVSIAATVASEPPLLLLDEPVADLDRDSTTRVVAALKALNRERGTTIVIAEHHPRPFAELAQQWFTIEGGRLSEQAAAPELAAEAVRPPDQVSSLQRADEGNSIALCTNRTISLSGTEVVKSVSLSLQPATVTALVGANGCGKTTLLESIAIEDRRANEAVAMVVHNVDDLFFRQTVHDEAIANDRRNLLAEGTTLARIRSLLPHFHDEFTHPRDCSAGTRVVMAIALQLAHNTSVLLLDEPTRGLDARARAELADVLRRVSAEGVAVLVATHDFGFANRCADTSITMIAGRVNAAEMVGA
jgi:energy-coupling factor transport system ATP-binding protein